MIYKHPNWSKSMPDIPDGSVVIDGMFSNCPGPPGDPVISDAIGVTLEGGNGNNRRFPKSWILNNCTNAQLKYTFSETVYETDDGDITEVEIEQELLGRTYDEAASQRPEEF